MGQDFLDIQFPHIDNKYTYSTISRSDKYDTNLLLKMDGPGLRSNNLSINDRSIS